METIFKDQMGRTIELTSLPNRIISCVPSQTEYLWDLGLNEQLIGRTKFCIHPAEMKGNIQVIGGTKNLQLEKISALNPDLIIGNKEENSQNDIEWLEKRFPVWMSDISNFETSIDSMRAIGGITGRMEKADFLINKILEEKLNWQETKNENTANKSSVLYLIWRNPYLMAGKNTYIDSMLEEFGLENWTTEMRYPELSINNNLKNPPNYVFLSSEPYPFKEKHVKELRKYLPNSTIVLVDGEMFSWYGSRLLQSFQYFSKLQSYLKSL
jgi:ABC-type Fe3+-hydroxamate transport system substrate-binding protein